MSYSSRTRRRGWKVLEGDSQQVLKRFPSNTFDSLVCDPPAGIAFLSRDWDKDKGGRDKWIAWLADIMREVLRTLKPGAHGLVWAIDRTSHWTATALEDAGFEIRGIVHHLFGSGFPKNLDVSKVVDDYFGVEREVVGHGDFGKSSIWGNWNERETDGISNITVPNTPQAKQWDGWGTALKPAAEEWILVRKPLDGTVAANVLKHGVGGLNIDGCRIGADPSSSRSNTFIGLQGTEKDGRQTTGRWPANVMLSHSPHCQKVHVYATRKLETPKLFLKEGEDPDTEVVKDEEEWWCADDCPIKIMDDQWEEMETSPWGGTKVSLSASTNKIYGKFGASLRYHNPSDEGDGASRFFKTFTPRFLYAAKPSVSEREMGLGDSFERVAGAVLTNRKPDSAGVKHGRAGPGHGGGSKNIHPTVKSLDLMNYLIKLCTPPGGIVLDPFCGSGSTGMAAVQLGHRFVGIELGADYAKISRARIGHAARTRR